MDKVLREAKKIVISHLFQRNAVKIDLVNGYLLKSGIMSPVIFNLGVLGSDVTARTQISAAVPVLLAKYHDFNTVAGVASGGFTWASHIAESRVLPFLRVYHEPKPYGLYQQIEGEVPRNAKVLVMDESVTTGDSAMAAIKALWKQGAKVTEMCSIFDWRFPSVDEKFAQAGIKKISLTSFQEVLDYGFENGLLSEEAKPAIDKFCEQYR